jgi:FkbM family methyltransferase
MPALSYFQIGDVSLMAYDEVESHAAQWIAWELLRDDYHVGEIDFDEDDIVVDIGAHVGLFSMYLSKRWPFLKILAFEPFPDNYRNCVENLRINSVDNVVLSPNAIVHDKRPLSMATDPDNSGGASALVHRFETNGVEHDLPSMTLDEVFQIHSIDRCKLLKIDCEGMEYEILEGTRVLDKVEYLSGEFHSSGFLHSQGRSPQRLYAYCQEFFGEGKLHVEFKDIPS